MWCDCVLCWVLRRAYFLAHLNLVVVWKYLLGWWPSPCRGCMVGMHPTALMGHVMVDGCDALSSILENSASSPWLLVSYFSWIDTTAVFAIWMWHPNIIRRVPLNYGILWCSIVKTSFDHVNENIGLTLITNTTLTASNFCLREILKNQSFCLGLHWLFYLIYLFTLINLLHSSNDY